jgi:hypothetical protein
MSIICSLFHLNIFFSTPNILSNHISQCVIFFVDGEYCSIWHLRILLFDDPRNKLLPWSQIWIHHCFKLQSYNLEATATYFFSPSNKRNDSNVGGAFIFTTNKLSTIRSYKNDYCNLSSTYSASFYTLQIFLRYITLKVLVNVFTTSDTSGYPVTHCIETIAQRNSSFATSDSKCWMNQTLLR